jgi:hypothetical protein
MTRAVRLGCFLFTVLGATAYAGCGTATTLEEIDSGTPGIDTGPILVLDTGIVPIGDASVVQDTGMVTPFDSGMVMPPIDGGPFMRPVSGRTRPDTGMPMTDPDSGTTTGVMCGTEVCGAAEECCITRGTGGMMIAQACVATGTCMGAALSCDGPEDCMTGEACCGSFIGGAAGAMCVADTMCARGRFCHADTDCTGMDTCCSFMGVSICSPRCF